VLLVAAALTLTIVLTLAGMLGRGLVLDEEDASVGGSSTLSCGLRVKTYGRTAKKASECGREGKVLGCVDFHWELLLWLATRSARRYDVVGSVAVKPPDALLLNPGWTLYNSFQT